MKKQILLFACMIVLVLTLGVGVLDACCSFLDNSHRYRTDAPHSTEVCGGTCWWTFCDRMTSVTLPAHGIYPYDYATCTSGYGPPGTKIKENTNYAAGLRCNNEGANPSNGNTISACQAACINTMYPYEVSGYINVISQSGSPLGSSICVQNQ